MIVIIINRPFAAADYLWPPRAAEYMKCTEREVHCCGLAAARESRSRLVLLLLLHCIYVLCAPRRFSEPAECVIYWAD
jgi:hypothetical protein